ncbi:hypothetical protein PBTT_00582 [Plasmodiophora brassicae]
MTTRFARTGSHCVRNPTGKGPAHLNKVAFKHNDNSGLSKLIMAIPIRGVCARCYDIIEWKKTFRKYKPLQKARRCDSCRADSVTAAYMVICDPCGKRLQCCTKCKSKFSETCRLKETECETAATPDEIEKALAGFKERRRRAMTRAIENGSMTLAQVLEMCDSVGNLRIRNLPPKTPPSDNDEDAGSTEGSVESDAPSDDGYARYNREDVDK